MCLLVQAIFIPVVGILGNDYDRILLICIGSVVWGAMSTGFGFARDLKQVSLLYASHLMALLPAGKACDILRDVAVTFQLHNALHLVAVLSAWQGGDMLKNLRTTSLNCTQEEQPFTHADMTGDVRRLMSPDPNGIRGRQSHI